MSQDHAASKKEEFSDSNLGQSNFKLDWSTVERNTPKGFFFSFARFIIMKHEKEESTFRKRPETAEDPEFRGTSRQETGKANLGMSQQLLGAIQFI